MSIFSKKENVIRECESLELSNAQNGIQIEQGEFQHYEGSGKFRKGIKVSYDQLGMLIGWLQNILDEHNAFIEKKEKVK
jgi:hypothetical protein